MTTEAMPSQKAMLPWAIVVLVVGVSGAMVGSTFMRERREAVAAEELIRFQQKNIRELNREIDRMNRDIRSMQNGIGQMQQELVRLQKIIR